MHTHHYPYCTADSCDHAESLLSQQCMAAPHIKHYTIHQHLASLQRHRWQRNIPPHSRQLCGQTGLVWYQATATRGSRFIHLTAPCKPQAQHTLVVNKQNDKKVLALPSNTPDLLMYALPAVIMSSCAAVTPDQVLAMKFSICCHWSLSAFVNEGLLRLEPILAVAAAAAVCVDDG